MFRILVAEDELHNREALHELLTRLGYEVELAVDGKEALERATSRAFDLIFSDVRMPRMDGLAFFDAYQKLMGNNQQAAFVFMTAYGRLEEAVDAMRRGALNFLSKPLKKKDLVGVIEEAKKQIDMKSAQLKEKRDTSIKKASETGEAVYVSRVFSDVVQMVDRVAPSLASVLFVGESGTGKEVMARRLHLKSARANAPYIAFNAAGTPETLLESALFGHERGAFTGAEESRIGYIRQAHGGTFFIDEVGSMPLTTQSKLLRVLQDRMVLPLGAVSPMECDVRWVSATNVALESLVEKNKFREDLLYRLKVIVIELPPLRDRVGDVEVLTKYFLHSFSERDGKPPLELHPKVLEVLQNYAWPGNVRELQNVIERAVALADGNQFNIDLLPPHIAGERSREIKVLVGSSLESVEDKLIEETLRSCNGDKVQAAAILGIAPRTIYRWIEKKNEQQGT